jgi:hypothetical protein
LQRFAREAGHCPKKIQNRYFRPWLFLAPSFGMSARQRTRDSSRLLDAKIRENYPTRCKEPERTKGTRVGSIGGLGMRAEIIK